MQDRHSRLLTSNAAPEPAEIAAIREDISARIKDIDQLGITLEELDTEIERSEVERRRVQAQRRDVQRKLEDMEAGRVALGGLLTSFRRLPVEMLSQIFIAVYDDPEVKDKAQQVSALCRVCRRWCDAAMYTPRLWRRLKLSRSDLYKCDPGKLSRRFARSGTLSGELSAGGRERQCCVRTRYTGRSLDSAPLTSGGDFVTNFRCAI